jgi:hypothetical protein
MRLVQGSLTFAHLSEATLYLMSSTAEAAEDDEDDDDDEGGQASVPCGGVLRVLGVASPKAKMTVMRKPVHRERTAKGAIKKRDLRNWPVSIRARI